MALFQELNEEGVTILIVTHEPDIARYAKRLVEVRDGRILRDEPMKNRQRRQRRSLTALVSQRDRMRKSTLMKVATQSILKNKMRTVPDDARHRHRRGRGHRDGGAWATARRRASRSRSARSAPT